MLREIRLYGALGREFGRVHRLAVDTAAEAVRALSVVLPGFEAYLRRHSEPGFHVWVGKQNVGEDDLSMPVGAAEPIRIAPVLAGSKKGGLFQTILGVALIAVGIFTGNPYLVASGASLALGGVAQLLTPTPKLQAGTQDDSRASNNFSSAVNVTAQGSPVPVLYGEMIVGSAVISAGIYTEDAPL